MRNSSALFPETGMSWPVMGTLGYDSNAGMWPGLLSHHTVLATLKPEDTNQCQLHHKITREVLFHVTLVQKILIRSKISEMVSQPVMLVASSCQFVCAETTLTVLVLVGHVQNEHKFWAAETNVSQSICTHAAVQCRHISLICWTFWLGASVFKWYIQKL